MKKYFIIAGVFLLTLSLTGCLKQNQDVLNDVSVQQPVNNSPDLSFPESGDRELVIDNNGEGQGSLPQTSFLELSGDYQGLAGELNISEWNTYANQTYGFLLYYPEDFMVNDISQEYIEFFSHGLGNFFDIRIAPVEENDLHAQNVLRTNSTTINGLEYLIEESKEGTINSLAFFTTVNGNEFKFEYKFFDDSSGDWIDLFQKTISTVNFL